MRQTIKTEALVLRKKSLLEKDIIYTFFSKDLGKIRVIAKGIKKITSRRSAHTQTGNLTAIELYAKGDIYYLQNTAIISAFSQIKSDVSKVNMLYRFLFILDRILPDSQPEPEVYQVMLKFLIWLAKAENISDIELSQYLSRILGYLGYGSEQKNISDMVRKIEEIIHEKVPEHVII